MNKARKVLLLVFSWLAVVFIMAIIASFSLQDANKSTATSELILNLFSFFDKLMPGVLDIIHVIIRKCAHLFIYVVLGFFVFNAYNTTVKIKRVWVYILSVGLSVNFAVIDEFVFQAITSGRAPMLLDVCIDTTGAIIGAAIMLLITLLIKIIKNKETSS